MGFMSAGDMMEEIASNLGGGINDNTRLLRMVNWAILNLASYVILPELEKKDSTLTITTDDTDFTKPTDLLGVIRITLWDDTLDTIVYKTLRKMKKEFYPATATGQPTHYKIRGTDIIIWPKSDGDYVGEIEYVKIPAIITSPATIPEFDAYWDVGLVMLGTHYGLLSLRQHDEADRWLGRFLGYAASRKLEHDVSADAPQGGIEVVWDYDEVIEIPSRIIESL